MVRKSKYQRIICKYKASTYAVYSRIPISTNTQRLTDLREI